MGLIGYRPENEQCSGRTPKDKSGVVENYHGAFDLELSGVWQ